MLKMQKKKKIFKIHGDWIGSLCVLWNQCDSWKCLNEAIGIDLKISTSIHFQLKYKTFLNDNVM